MTYQIPRGLIIEALENAASDEDSIRDNYSGRGMYGTTCPAITLPGHNEALRFFVELAHLTADTEEHHDAVTWMADAAIWDTMGDGLVFYWRRLELTDD